MEPETNLNERRITENYGFKFIVYVLLNGVMLVCI